MKRSLFPYGLFFAFLTANYTLISIVQKPTPRYNIFNWRADYVVLYLGAMFICFCLQWYIAGLDYKIIRRHMLKEQELLSEKKAETEKELPSLKSFVVINDDTGCRYDFMTDKKHIRYRLIWDTDWMTLQVQKYDALTKQYSMLGIYNNHSVHNMVWEKIPLDLNPQT